MPRTPAFRQKLPFATLFVSATLMIAPPFPIRRAAVGTVQIANNVKLEAIAKVLPGWYVVPVPVFDVFHPANVNPCLASVPCPRTVYVVPDA
jgi:type III secretory pathway component EscR